MAKNASTGARIAVIGSGFLKHRIPDTRRNEYRPTEPSVRWNSLAQFGLGKAIPCPRIATPDMPERTVVVAEGPQRARQFSSVWRLHSKSAGPSVGPRRSSDRPTPRRDPGASLRCCSSLPPNECPPEPYCPVSGHRVLAQHRRWSVAV